MKNLVATIVPLTLLFGTYELRVGERYSSPSLFAEGRLFRADVLTEMVVFAALVGHNRQKFLFDF